MLKACILLSVYLAFECAAQSDPAATSGLAPQPVAHWLRASAVPLGGASAFATMDGALAGVRVLALGEATHGQHEAFELKRAWTMHLVRNKGFRYVAHEASASSARAAEDYIAGRTSDRRAAVRGLGMLIWMVEENAELLDDLRAWNQQAAAADQVHFFGVDAQDGKAVLGRMAELLVAHPTLIARIQAIAPRAEEAIGSMFRGDRSGFESIEEDVGSLRSAIEAAAANDPQRATIMLHARELCAYLIQYGSPGGRDRAMAELLMLQLEPAGKEARCVFWAHNAHVQRSALAYLNSEQLAGGGHLAQALGTAYYAVGFTFGQGTFQATAPNPAGGHGFRRYTHRRVVPGSLEHQLASATAADHFIDLRSAPGEVVVQEWLTSGHGFRWWGGYQIPEDVDAATADLARMSRMHPVADFDGLVFLAQTTAAQPIDAKLILDH
jgi:erythromycin esterase